MLPHLQDLNGLTAQDPFYVSTSTILKFKYFYKERTEQTL